MCCAQAGYSSWSSLICDFLGPIIGNYKGFPWRASRGIAVLLPQDSRPANLLQPQPQKGDTVRELAGEGGGVKRQIQQRGCNNFLTTAYSSAGMGLKVVRDHTHTDLYPMTVAL